MRAFVRPTPAALTLEWGQISTIVVRVHVDLLSLKWEARPRAVCGQRTMTTLEIAGALALRMNVAQPPVAAVVSPIFEDFVLD